MNNMTLVSSVLNRLLGPFLGSDLFVSLVFVVLVLILLRVVQVYWYIRTLPPGPWGVPLLGYLPFLSGVAHQQFTEMSKKYGSTFSLRLGSQLIVVLSDYKSIRKAFRREAFSGRPVNDISAIIEGYGELLQLSKHYKVSHILTCTHILMRHAHLAHSLSNNAVINESQNEITINIESCIISCKEQISHSRSQVASRNKKRRQKLNYIIEIAMEI